MLNGGAKRSLATPECACGTKQSELGMAASLSLYEIIHANANGEERWVILICRYRIANGLIEHYQLRKAIPDLPASDRAVRVPLLLADRQTVQLNPASAYDLD